jgi:CRISPR-associated endoribonuclease Cas6
MERERLSSILLEFQAHHEALVPRATGRLLHAMFLNLIAQFDEARSKQLHDEPHYRPFTVSSLQGAQIREEFALLRRGQTYTCRVTLLDGGELQQQFQTHVCQAHRIPVHLDNAVLSLTRVISPPSMDSRGWINSTTWKRLVTLPPADIITMHFLSPTAFSMGDRAFKLFPDPTWVWGSLLRDWNRYAPACFQIDKTFIQEAVAAAICVASCQELHTETLRYASYIQKGFLGTCSYALQDPVSAPYLTALAAFAPYSGVGSKTTMGMGQTLVTWAASRGDQTTALSLQKNML